MPEKKIETYLGDGVYATYDRFGIVLDLRGQDDFTFISLGEKEFDALVKWGNKKFGNPEATTPQESEPHNESELLTACKATLDAITKQAQADGTILWVEPPYQLAGVHESVAERLMNVIADAEGTPST